MRKSTIVRGMVAALPLVAGTMAMGVPSASAEEPTCTTLYPDEYTTADICMSDVPPTGYYRVCAIDRYNSFCGEWAPYNEVASVRTEYVTENSWVETTSS